MSETGPGQPRDGETQAAVDAAHEAADRLVDLLDGLCKSREGRAAAADLVCQVVERANLFLCVATKAGNPQADKTLFLQAHRLVRRFMERAKAAPENFRDVAGTTPTMPWLRALDPRFTRGDVETAKAIGLGSKCLVPSAELTGSPLAKASSPLGQKGATLTAGLLERIVLLRQTWARDYQSPNKGRLWPTGNQVNRCVRKLGRTPPRPERPAAGWVQEWEEHVAGGGAGRPQDEALFRLGEFYRRTRLAMPEVIAWTSPDPACPPAALHALTLPELAGLSGAARNRALESWWQFVDRWVGGWGAIPESELDQAVDELAVGKETGTAAQRLKAVRDTFKREFKRLANSYLR